jgi:hypothetical protein
LQKHLYKGIKGAYNRGRQEAAEKTKGAMKNGIYKVRAIPILPFPKSVLAV